MLATRNGAARLGSSPPCVSYPRSISCNKNKIHAIAYQPNRGNEMLRNMKVLGFLTKTNERDTIQPSGATSEDRQLTSMFSYSPAVCIIIRAPPIRVVVVLPPSCDGGGEVAD